MHEEYDSGRARLLELGIRQTLHRPLQWTQNCAICYCIISPLTGITGLYAQGLLYGGPVVLIWGWIVASAMTIFVTLSMSELSSAYPVAGGLYFWSFMLSRQYGPVAAWTVGWFNLLGQLALVAGDSFSCIQSFLALLFFVTDDNGLGGYTPGAAMELYLFGGLLSMYAVINLAPLKVLGRVAQIGFFIHIVGTLAVCATLLGITDQQRSLQWVLTHYQDFSGSGINSKAYVSVLGLLTALWTLTGYDAPAHLIEETRSGDTTAGWPALYAVVASAITGLMYLLALTLCLPDVASLMNANNTNGGVNLVAQIYWTLWQTKFGNGVGGMMLFMTPLISNWFSGLLRITSASRMLYGFARDRAVPGWSFWQKVDQSGVPYASVLGVSGLAFLLGLPLLKSVVAFSATTSIAVLGLAISYGMPIMLRLIFAGHHGESGPFTLGRLSVPIACVAATWLLFSAIVVMLPSVYPVTSLSISAPITFGGAVVLILLAWLVTGRYSFHGPRLNVENSDIVHIKYWVTDPPRVLCPK